jgi:hypothetical protein
VGGVARHLLERLYDHRFHLVVGDGAHRSRTRIIRETVKASSEESPSPLRHRLLGRVQVLGYNLVVESLCAGEDDPAAERQ